VSSGGAREGGWPGGAGSGVWHCRRPSTGRRKVGDEGSGSLVNSAKFKIQFCSFNFSPSSWPQMKKC
jgi:hypothetical protein